MKARLRNWWTSHTPRERAILAALAVVLGIALYGAYVHMAGRARDQLRAGVDTLRAQSARLDQYAGDLERARAVTPLPASTSEVTQVIREQAGEHGLSGALVRMDAPEAAQATVEFGAVAFADWLKLLEALGNQGVRLESCRVEALSAAGTVNVTATLVRQRPQ